MGKIRATDDEQLARSLWGDNCEWDEERQQYVPTKAKPLAEEKPTAAQKPAQKRAATRAAKAEE